MQTDVVIRQLPESSDQRGSSYSLTAEVIDDLTIRDVHIAAVHPGHVRGNHYHTKKTELITVVYADAWSLHWDTGPGTTVSSKNFGGSGAVTVSFPFNWSHAVRNDGSTDLWLFNVTDMSFDRSLTGASQDAPPRKVV